MKGPHRGRLSLGTYLAYFSLLYVNLTNYHFIRIRETFRYLVKLRYLVLHDYGSRYRLPSHLFRSLSLLSQFRLNNSILCSLKVPYTGRPFGSGHPTKISYILICRSLVVLLAVTSSGATAGEVRFAVIAPRNPGFNEPTLQQILPPLRLAAKAVTDNVTGRLPGWRIHLLDQDSNCSSITGPLAAIKHHDGLGKCTLLLIYKVI